MLIWRSDINLQNLRTLYFDNWRIKEDTSGNLLVQVLTTTYINEIYFMLLVVILILIMLILLMIGKLCGY